MHTYMQPSPPIYKHVHHLHKTALTFSYHLATYCPIPYASPKPPLPVGIGFLHEVM